MSREITKQDCRQWLLLKTKNPITNRNIKENGPVYKKLAAACSRLNLNSSESEDDDRSNIDNRSRIRQTQRSRQANARANIPRDQTVASGTRSSRGAQRARSGSRSGRRSGTRSGSGSSTTRRTAGQTAGGVCARYNRRIIQPTLIPLPSQEFIVDALDEKIRSGFVVVNDKVGTGKTAAFLLWVFTRKARGLDYNTRIIVPRNIIFQWQQDLDNFFPGALTYQVVTTTRNYENHPVDVLLCIEPTAHLPFNHIYTCYDEVSTITNKTSINGFLPFPSILLSSDTNIDWRTPTRIIGRTLIQKIIQSEQIGLENHERTRTWSNASYLKKLLDRFGPKLLPDIHMDDLVTIRPSQTLQFQDPIIKIHQYAISRTANVASEFLTPRMVAMLKENDMKTVIKTLKDELEKSGVKISANIGNEDNNLLSWIKLLKLRELEKAVADYRLDKSEFNKNKISRIKTQIAELTEKYTEILEGDCDICCCPLADPVFLPCCQHVICQNCKSQIDKCPFCRNTRMSGLTVAALTAATTDNPVIKSLPVVVADIANNARALIVFQHYKGNLEEDIQQEVQHLRGTASQRNKIVQNYKAGIIKILFLNVETDHSGVRLENTTDILFLENPSPTVQTQIIGRALRLGRDENLPLIIHKLKLVQTDNLCTV